MNEEERLAKISNVLEQNIHDPLAGECADCIRHNTILFNSGFESERQHLYDVYKTRLHIAKDLKRDKFVEEDLVFWERALAAIEDAKDEKMILTWFQSDSFVYLIFLTSNLQNLISIIRLTSEKPLSESENHYDNIINSEHPTKVSAAKFEKGQLVKKWK